MDMLFTSRSQNRSMLDDHSSSSQFIVMDRGILLWLWLSSSFQSTLFCHLPLDLPVLSQQMPNLDNSIVSITPQGRVSEPAYLLHKNWGLRVGKYKISVSVNQTDDAVMPANPKSRSPQHQDFKSVKSKIDAYEYSCYILIDSGRSNTRYCTSTIRSNCGWTPSLKHHPIHDCPHQDSIWACAIRSIILRCPHKKPVLYFSLLNLGRYQVKLAQLAHTLSCKSR